MTVNALNVEDLVEHLQGLETARSTMADHLEKMAALVTVPPGQAVTASTLDLPEVQADLKAGAKKLRDGTFRLLVLGDMKRGKSTFLNSLLGADLLPADVNPCTAIITVLRYGETPGVTIEYTEESGKASISTSFEEFKRDYTVPPDKAKVFAESGEKAFPDIKQAVVRFPLELLKNKVEIVDSPGLNDTEERNNITFSYLKNVHAILFMMDATQPFTHLEQSYLENSLKGRGLNIFFLINRWNMLKAQLLNPNDPAALARAEDNQRIVFHTGLEPYANVDGQDLYASRVFEINALGALQGRIEGKPLDALIDTT